MEILLGLGGNVGDVAGAFRRAASQLASRFGRARASSIWRTAPVGPAQPDYLNATLLLDADVHPLRLLAICRALEAEAGRDRGREQRWGPRPLDIDLVMVLGLVHLSPALTLPHPELERRLFVLLPACELAGGWRHPRRMRPLAELAAGLDRDEQRCERLGPFA